MLSNLITRINQLQDVVEVLTGVEIIRENPLPQSLKRGVSGARSNISSLGSEDGMRGANRMAGPNLGPALFAGGDTKKMTVDDVIAKVIQSTGDDVGDAKGGASGVGKPQNDGTLNGMRGFGGKGGARRGSTAAATRELAGSGDEGAAGMQEALEGRMSALADTFTRKMGQGWSAEKQLAFAKGLIAERDLEIEALRDLLMQISKTFDRVSYREAMRPEFRDVQLQLRALYNWQEKYDSPLDVTYVNLETENARLRDELRRSAMAKDEMGKDIVTQSALQESLESTMKQMTNMVNELRDKLGKHDEEKLKLTREYEGKLRQMEMEVKNITMEKTQLQARLTVLEDRGARGGGGGGGYGKRGIARRRSSATNIHNYANFLETELDKTMQSADKVQNIVNQKGGEITDLYRKINVLNSEIFALKADNGLLRSEIEERESIVKAILPYFKKAETAAEAMDNILKDKENARIKRFREQKDEIEDRYEKLARKYRFTRRKYWELQTLYKDLVGNAPKAGSLEAETDVPSALPTPRLSIEDVKKAEAFLQQMSDESPRNALNSVADLFEKPPRNISLPVSRHPGNETGDINVPADYIPQSLEDRFQRRNVLSPIKGREPHRSSETTASGIGSARFHGTESPAVTHGPGRPDMSPVPSTIRSVQERGETSAAGLVPFASLSGEEMLAQKENMKSTLDLLEPVAMTGEAPTDLFPSKDDVDQSGVANKLNTSALSNISEVIRNRSYQALPRQLLPVYNSLDKSKTGRKIDILLERRRTLDEVLAKEQMLDPAELQTLRKEQRKLIEEKVKQHFFKEGATGQSSHGNTEASQT